MCSTDCALIATIRRLDGSCRSSRSWRLWRSAGFTTQVISVPPEVSDTHDVSGRRASASATLAAASGTHCSRTVQSDMPSRCQSGSPLPRVAPGDGLLGCPDHRGDVAERRSPIDDQGMDDLPVKLVKTQQFNRLLRNALEESCAHSHLSGVLFPRHRPW